MKKPSILHTISVIFVLILIILAGIENSLYGQESSKSENSAVESAQMEETEKQESDDPGKDVQIDGDGHDSRDNGADLL